MGAIEAHLIRRRVHVEGVVQGVGFRPYVYRLATDLGLAGFIRNDVIGVDIEIEGPGDAVARFLERLPVELPAMSHIARTAVEVVAPLPDSDRAFSIVSSHDAGQLLVAVTPDAHVCDDCLRELDDPSDRRFRYPFLNCTHCGPRFTIVRRVPYDRPNTTMSAFPMCADCRREYEDPDDRRFHAQPVACPACGPQLWLVEPGGTAERPQSTASGDQDPIKEVRERLWRGEVVAVKGVGGFHLAVLANDERAVSTLRHRKGREGGKPFAVMARDLEQARRIAHVGAEEAALLASTARPIVLLRRRLDADLAASVAPDLETVGVMLPYSPLHHLLLEHPMAPLVMTSGNPTEEPITTANDEALRRLGPLCDALLLHDRDIHSGCDDSVTQVVVDRPQILRRARGYVPRPIDVRALAVSDGVIALGGEMKGAVCVTRPGQLVLGRHLGELTHLTTQTLLRDELELMTSLLGVTPRIVAHDLHPDYFTTRLAEERASREGLERVAVQHHHAHLASCLAEHDVAPETTVLGVIFDGTGYGPDGTIWGGELLVGSYQGYRRAAHLRAVPLPGGDAAIRSPFRTALAHLLDALGPEALELAVPSLLARPRSLLEDLARMIEADIACPRSCGMGRLFDAVAAIVGVPGTQGEAVTYEAQAAMELEALAARAFVAQRESAAYSVELIDDEGTLELDTRPLIRSVVHDVLNGTARETVAARFHHAVVEATAAAVERIAEAEGVESIALSGGCFHNALLLSGLSSRLEALGYHVLRQERAPCGDGGLALGQAAVASITMREET